MLKIRNSSGKVITLPSGRLMPALRSALASFSSDVRPRKGCLAGASSNHYRIECFRLTDQSYTLAAPATVLKVDGTETSRPSCRIRTSFDDKGFGVCQVYWTQDVVTGDDPTCARTTDVQHQQGGTIETWIDTARDVICLMAYQLTTVRLLATPPTERRVFFYSELPLCGPVGSTALNRNWPTLSFTNSLTDAYVTAHGEQYTLPTGEVVNIAATQGTCTLTLACAHATPSGGQTCGCCNQPRCQYEWRAKYRHTDGVWTDGPTRYPDTEGSPGICASIHAFATDQWVTYGFDETYCYVRYVTLGACCAEDGQCAAWPDTPALPIGAPKGCSNCSTFVPEWSINLIAGAPICVSQIRATGDPSGTWAASGLPFAVDDQPSDGGFDIYDTDGCTGTLLGHITIDGSLGHRLFVNIAQDSVTDGVAKYRCRIVIEVDENIGGSQYTFSATVFDGFLYGAVSDGACGYPKLLTGTDDGSESPTDPRPWPGSKVVLALTNLPA